MRAGGTTVVQAYFVLKCQRMAPWILKKHLKAKAERPFWESIYLAATSDVSSSDEGKDKVWAKLLGKSMCEAWVNEWGVYAERRRWSRNKDPIQGSCPVEPKTLQ